MKVTIEVTATTPEELKNLAQEIFDNLESDSLWSPASAAARVLISLANKMKESK